MRFKEFLLEREYEKLEEAVEKVRANCKPFLKAAKGKPLFRGIGKWQAEGTTLKHVSDELGRYTSHPTTRAPKDSSNQPDFNFCFDAGCELAFNVKDIRKTTVFAASHPGLAATFGNVFLFFPVGEFKFLYSSIIHDSFESAGRFREEIAESMDKWRLKSSNIRNAMSVVAKDIEPHAWVENDGIERTARAFNIPQDEQIEFYDTLKHSLQHTYRYFYKNDQNLQAAIDSRNEILFYETHGYYALPLKLFSMEMERRSIDHEKPRRADDEGGSDERIVKFALDFIKGKIK